jgi:hypothetical protein
LAHEHLKLFAVLQTNGMVFENESFAEKVESGGSGANAVAAPVPRIGLGFPIAAAYAAAGWPGQSPVRGERYL